MFKSLKLENYRSHKKFELLFDQTTVLVGRNGAGKSNVLEAVTLLSFCRSFREEDKKNLINYDSEFARITGDDLEIFVSKTPRLMMRAKENGAPRKMVDFIGTLPAIIFSAETISIITGSPTDRRRFLDVMISQTNKEYFRSLLDYKKVRSQRNNLLQRIGQGQGSESELSFWDKELCRLGESIVKKRDSAVASLNQSISLNYKKISGDSKTGLALLYRKSGSGDLQSDLLQSRRREITCGKTLYGPHRDDLFFELGGRNMSSFCSRGELRSAILALKLCELEFIENALLEKTARNYKKPILLLDDIFSEFDPERRAHLGDLITSYQSLITSTEKSHLSGELLQKAKVVELM